jgi:serine/threonine-protein kinase RsbW
LTLTLPSDLRLLPVARAFMEAVCQVADFNKETAKAVVFAGDEAINNAIRHAHHSDSTTPIEIQFFLWPDHLEIRIHDQGDPFDLNAVPDLDPSEVRIGGRGVFLMRKLMDEVTCQPRGPRGNTLRMIKRWESNAVAPQK